jgi:hypothetical protein
VSYRIIKGVVVGAQGGILGSQWVHLVEARQHGVVGAEVGLPPAGGGVGFGGAVV